MRVTVYIFCISKTATHTPRAWVCLYLRRTDCNSSSRDRAEKHLLINEKAVHGCCAAAAAASYLKPTLTVTHSFLLATYTSRFLFHFIFLPVITYKYYLLIIMLNRRRNRIKPTTKTLCATNPSCLFVWQRSTELNPLTRRAIEVHGSLRAESQSSRGG